MSQGWFGLRMFDYSRIRITYDETDGRRHYNDTLPTKPGIYLYGHEPTYWGGTDDRPIRRAGGSYDPVTKVLKRRCRPFFNSMSKDSVRVVLKGA